MFHWFGTDDIAFDATTDDPRARGVTRRMPSFIEAARENARSRVYLGVHFDFDADDADDAGTFLADYSVEHSLLYNESNTELLYRRETNAKSPTECDELGRQLDNQHRWGSYRCVWRQQFTSYDLYVS